jgi:hypothetical protein
MSFDKPLHSLLYFIEPEMLSLHMRLLLVVHFLLSAVIFRTMHRRTAWGVQKGRIRLQDAHPVGGHPCKAISEVARLQGLEG